MPNYFCVSVRFVDPLPSFHGKGDNGVFEWPPSPLRVYQALVAAAASRGPAAQFAEYKSPLTWLCSQPPPLIVAPEAQTGIPFRTAVPNNDLDKLAKDWARTREPDKQPSELKTLKPIRRTYLRGGDTVHYLWVLPDSHAEVKKHRQALCTAARSITHLGWGIDMVVADASIMPEEEAQCLTGHTWRPVEDMAAKGYRVAVPGTLEALMSKHQAFLNRVGADGFNPVPPLSAFRVVGYRRSTDAPPRPYAAFKLLQPDSDRPRAFMPTRAVAVAGMVRCLAGKLARQTAHAEAGTPLDDWVNEYVMGHSDADGLRPRFSYLPLPSIERRGESGRVLGGIRRLIVAEPPGGSGAHAAWAGRTLRGQVLLSEQQREEALLVGTGAGDWVLEQYTREAESWATVTPVVLPGSDDGKAQKAERLFFKALRHAGYAPEALADFEFRAVGFWAGGEPALRFQRPRYLRDGHWSVYHMRLRWRHALLGPLALGAGRHCGLGIFAAFD